LLTKLRGKQDCKTESYPFLGRLGSISLRRAITLKDLSTRYTVIELRTCIYGIIDHDNYRVAQDCRYLAIKFLAVGRAPEKSYQVLHSQIKIGEDPNTLQSVTLSASSQLDSLSQPLSPHHVLKPHTPPHQPGSSCVRAKETGSFCAKSIRITRYFPKRGLSQLPNRGSLLQAFSKSIAS
jgi:hypothetical protein